METNTQHTVYTPLQHYLTCKSCHHITDMIDTSGNCPDCAMVLAFGVLDEPN